MKTPIITIGRQYGSGGHEVGSMLAQKLGVPFYDKELIELAAQKSGMDSRVLESVDEKASSSLLYGLWLGSQALANRYRLQQELPLNDKLYFLQAEVIQQAAMKGSCVIVGRCANHLLRKNPKALHVFIHAPLEQRISRIMRLQDVDEAQAEARIRKTDKVRAAHYEYYTDSKWGRTEDYDLCVNMAHLGVEDAVAVIAMFVTQCRA